MKSAACRGLILSAILIVAIPNRASAQPGNGFWQQTNGPYGGPVFAMYFDSTVALAGGLGGVFVSSNGGTGWRHAGLGSKSPVNNIVRLADHFFVSTERHGVFRSDDGGYNWFEVNSDLSTIRDLIVLDSLLFVGTEYDGIFRSTDFGYSWEPMNEGIDNNDIELLYEKNGVLIASAAGGSGSGMFRSVDRGASWVRLDPDPFAWNAEVMCESGSTLFAADFQNHAKVYRSTDDGLTWHLPSAASAPSDIIISLYADEAGLYAGVMFHGVFRSTTHGATWLPVSTGLYDKSVYSFASDGSLRFAGTYDGIYRSDSSGREWTKSSHGLTNSLVFTLAATDQHLFAGTHGGGIYRSSDAGENWNRLTLPVEKHYVNDIIGVDGVLYAITGGTPYWGSWGTILVSFDDGETWSEQNAGAGSSELKQLAATADHLFLTSDNGLFRTSISQPLSWRLLTGLPNNNRPNINSIAATGSIVIASTGSSYVHRSTNNGTTWSTASLGSPASTREVRVLGTKVFAGSGQVNHVHMSEDSGATWSELPVPHINGYVEDFAGSADTTFIAVSSYYGFYRDGGVLTQSSTWPGWRWLEEGLFNPQVLSVDLYRRRLFAGTLGSGVFRYVDSTEVAGSSYVLSPQDGETGVTQSTRLEWACATSADTYHLQLSSDAAFLRLVVNDSTLTDTSYVTEQLSFATTYYWRVRTMNAFGSGEFTETSSFTTETPQRVELDQNYPNPFNAETTIGFLLPSAGQVTIRTYNILGEEVALVFSAERTAGEHSIVWDAGSYPSGVYFYRLHSGGVVETRKMVLVR